MIYDGGMTWGGETRGSGSVGGGGGPKYYYFGPN